MAAPAADSDQTSPENPMDLTIDDASPDWEWDPDSFEKPRDLTEYVQVLHGYGRLKPTERHFIDEYEFVGGVCQRVPLTKAQVWKANPGFRVQIIKDLSAGPEQYAKAAGVRPMDPRKLAAVLGASDMDDLIKALGPQRTQQLLATLRDKLDARERAETRRARAR